MMDEVVGHMTEKVVIPPPTRSMLSLAATPPFLPASSRLYEPGEDLVPDMPHVGEGYNVHVTGLTHDERGYPDMTPDVQDRLVSGCRTKSSRTPTRFCLFEEEQIEGADVVVVSYGITSRVAQRAIEMAREKGIKVGKFRLITAWPFPEKTDCRDCREGEGHRGAEMNLGQMVREVERAAAGKVAGSAWWATPAAACTSPKTF